MSLKALTAPGIRLVVQPTGIKIIIFFINLQQSFKLETVARPA